jgi:hypothetical protein
MGCQTAIESKRNGPNLGENSRRKGGSSEWKVRAIVICLGKTDLSHGGIGQAGSRRQEERILTDSAGDYVANLPTCLVDMEAYCHPSPYRRSSYVLS